MPPAFSVVIPTYNQAELLKTALASVLSQTFGDFEVIITNNHSSDHTLDVIRGFNDSRVRVINFKNHGVIGAGRNVGIAEAQGEFVAFLDSDDTWHQAKLQKTWEVIQQVPQVGLVCHNQVMVRDEREVTQSTYGPPSGYSGSLYDYLLLVGNALSTSASAVARRRLEEVGGFSEDPAFITVEDYDLWLKLAAVCPFHFIPEVLGTHNFHPSSASANVELHMHAALAVLDKHCGELRNSQRPYPKMAVRQRYANVYFGAARQSQRNSAAGQSGGSGNFRKTLQYYLQALWTYPFHGRAYAGLGLLCADLLLGPARRKRIAYAIWGSSWRWE